MISLVLKKIFIKISTNLTDVFSFHFFLIHIDGGSVYYNIIGSNIIGNWYWYLYYRFYACSCTLLSQLMKDFGSTLYSITYLIHHHIFK